MRDAKSPPFVFGGATERADTTGAGSHGFFGSADGGSVFHSALGIQYGQFFGWRDQPGGGDFSSIFDRVLGTS